MSRGAVIEAGFIGAGTTGAYAAMARVLRDPEVARALTPCMRGEEGLYALTRRVREGTLWVVPVAVDGAQAGMFLAAPCDGGGLFGHQYVLPQYRTHSRELLRAACGKAFEMFPDVRHLVGLTPVTMRHAVVTALAAGFVKCGTWPQWCEGAEGSWVDCHCLILTREDYHGQK